MAYTPADVNGWYQSVQFRDGPTATVTSYVTLLNNGTMSPAQVQNAIISDPFTTSYVNPMIRIYQAAFNRVPDKAGQDFWVDNFAAGSVTTLTAATNFANSPEFKAQYGTTSANDPINAAVLTGFYQNVLNRNPDAAGYQFWLNSGQTIAQVLNYFAQSPEFIKSAQDATVLFQQAQVAGTAATSGSLFQYGGFPPAETFTLTTSTDTFVATKGNTVFNAYQVGGNSTWTLGDSITGTAGNNDVFNIVQTAAITNPFSSVVNGIETINATSNTPGTSSATGTSLNTTGFTGAQTVNVTTPGFVTLTGAGTTALNVTDTALGGGTISVNGGSNVVVNSTQATTAGTIAVGGTAAPIGTVAINSIVNAAGTATGAGITAAGGTIVSIAQTLNQSIGSSTVTAGAVVVNGGASTTAVSVKASSGAVASGGGVAYSTVAVNDANFSDATKAGTIATVTVGNTAGVTVKSAALATLNVSGKNTTIGTWEGGSTAATNTTLALNLNKATISGAITDNSDQFTTVKIDTGATAGVGNALNTGAAAFASASALKTISISGAGDLTANLTTGSVTAINANTATGNVTATINGTLSTYAGGSGVDTITVGASPTKAVAGGAGSADTIVLNYAGGQAVNPNVTGFEILSLGALADANAYNATGFTGLTVGNTAGASEFSFVAAGVDIAFTADNPYQIKYSLANATGLSDVVNVKQGADLSDTLRADGVETVNLIVGPNAAGGAVYNYFNLVDNAVKAINLSTGVNTSVYLDNISTTVRSVDASGVQGQDGSSDTGFIWASGVVADATGSLIVKGSVKGGDNIDLLLAADTTTVTVNAGSNFVRGSATKANVINGGVDDDFLFGGAASDVIIGNGGPDEITGGKSADKITLSGNTSIVWQAKLDSGANTAVAGQGAIAATGFDIMNGVQAGDKIGLDQLATFDTSVANAVTVQGVAGKVLLANGSLSNGVFTYSSSGSDTLVTYDADGSFESVVLVGFKATAGAGLTTLEDIGTTAWLTLG